jgi:hypothetical protein
MIRFPGQKREPDLERAVTEHELEIESRQEEPGEHRPGPEDPDGVRDGDVAQPKEAQRDERRSHSRLDADEDCKQDDGHREQAERPPVSQPISFPFTIA